MAATAAGLFSADRMAASFHYIGGACDNPNVLDKEAGVLAMQAFLSLYAGVDHCAPLSIPPHSPSYRHHQSCLHVPPSPVTLTPPPQQPPIVSSHWPHHVSATVLYRAVLLLLPLSPACAGTAHAWYCHTCLVLPILGLRNHFTAVVAWGGALFLFGFAGTI